MDMPTVVILSVVGAAVYFAGGIWTCSLLSRWNIYDEGLSALIALFWPVALPITAFVRWVRW